MKLMNPKKIRRPLVGLPEDVMAKYESCKCWECKKTLGWIKIEKGCSDTGGHPVLCFDCANKWLVNPKPRKPRRLSK